MQNRCKSVELGATKYNNQGGAEIGHRCFEFYELYVVNPAQIPSNKM